VEKAQGLQEPSPGGVVDDIMLQGNSLAQTNEDLNRLRYSERPMREREGAEARQSSDKEMSDKIAVLAGAAGAAAPLVTAFAPAASIPLLVAGAYSTLHNMNGIGGTNGQLSDFDGRYFQIPQRDVGDGAKERAEALSAWTGLASQIGLFILRQGLVRRPRRK
jgi:hypothetical protein